MSFLARCKKLIKTESFHKFTLFQGSTLQFLFTSLYRSRGRKPWLKILGSLPSTFSVSYKHELEKPRGRSHDGVFYSFGYTDLSPEARNAFISIISTHIDDIKEVLGENFLVNDPTFWRTTYIPESLRNVDIYSQVFHQDSVFDNFNIQIFVLLHDVDPSHGPFEWIEKEHHRRAFAQCKIRNCFALDGVPVSKLVGKKNDYLILSTGQSLHRDGVPNHGNERLIASIGLFPSYAKIGKPLDRF